ncbi:phosphodiester glycosidase family protein [uncultured Sulfitobacter sp.]|uniref:phosphodiester glycosidase family protein n=1 Tax=uncultured Sulfitobacter sp. TaxID=191468 RepID=UPI0026387AC2|nr:phosphodiester glycosidase family protein [uncultured Sulfitobacter sp.]
MIARALLGGLLAFAPLPAAATSCRTETVEGAPYTICEVDLSQETLHLFLNDRSDTPYGYFSGLDAALQAGGARLGFAMNAGMYHEDRTPVGLFLENGIERQSVITAPGPGNFGLLPNGVLCLRDGRADVIETLRFVQEAPACNSATQSGPMLVIDGALHPRFLENSNSRYIRNGVGTSDDGKIATFVISDAPVNFHTFGRVFRDHLGLRNALYFDGNVSRLRAPDLGRDDTGFAPLGPIIGVVEPAD